MGWEVLAGGRTGEGWGGAHVLEGRGQVRKKQVSVAVRETQTRPEVSWAGAGGRSSVPRIEHEVHSSPGGNTVGCLPHTHSPIGLDNNPRLHRVAVCPAR